MGFFFSIFVCYKNIQILKNSIKGPDFLKIHITQSFKQLYGTHSNNNLFKIKIKHTKKLQNLKTISPALMVPMQIYSK